MIWLKMIAYMLFIISTSFTFCLIMSGKVKYRRKVTDKALRDLIRKSNQIFRQVNGS